MPEPPQPELHPPDLQHWDFPRSVAGVCLLVRFAADHGVAEQRALAGSGLTAARLADPVGEVDAHQELRVARNIAAALADLPAAGIAAGRRYHATAFGMLGFAIMSSPTLLDAVNLASRYFELSFIFSVPSLSMADGQLRLGLDDAALPPDAARFLVERDLSAIHQVLAELVPGGMPLTSVSLAFDPPDDPAPYRAALGVPPEFGAAATVADFDGSRLAEPLPQANPETVAVCEAQCRALLARRRERDGVARQVRDALGGLGRVGDGLDAVAAGLGISGRTLRRRLAEAGTSFGQLQDEVREALAEELLGSSALSVEDVAVRLGYAEASSFIHAFKRWKGTTPSGYLRRRRGRG